jgi:hypothetical protein
MPSLPSDWAHPTAAPLPAPPPARRGADRGPRPHRGAPHRGRRRQAVHGAAGVGGRRRRALGRPAGSRGYRKQRPYVTDSPPPPSSPHPPPGQEHRHRRRRQAPRAGHPRRRPVHHQRRGAGAAGAPQEGARGVRTRGRRAGVAPSQALCLECCCILSPRRFRPSPRPLSHPLPPGPSQPLQPIALAPPPPPPLHPPRSRCWALATSPSSLRASSTASGRRPTWASAPTSRCAASMRRWARRRQSLGLRARPGGGERRGVR